MQSEYTHTVPNPSQLQQTFAQHSSGQSGPLYSGGIQLPQRNPRLPGADNYQYQDSGAIPSPAQAYNGGIVTPRQWPNSSQPAGEHTQSWLSSASSSNPPPPSYAPTASYDPQVYGAMSGVQQPSVGPWAHRGSLADTSMWGVRYNQNGATPGHASKPPLPPRPWSATQNAQNQYVPQSTPPTYPPHPPVQQPSTDQILTSYNFSGVSQFQGAHGQSPPPPPPPPKTPQYHQDLAVNEKPSQPLQSTYHHQSGHQLYPSTGQIASEYVEEPRYDEYRIPDSYQYTSPSSLPFATNSYHASAPAYHYQGNTHSGMAQPPYPPPMATPTSPSVQRRTRWPSIDEQPYPPIVSPPLPDHDVLVRRQDAPSTVGNTMPPSPTSTLDYEQQLQAYDVPDNPGWTQQPGKYRSFEYRTCQTCGQQTSDQGLCQFCGDAERNHATEQYMQGHVDPVLRQDRSSENQPMMGHNQVLHEDVTRQEPPHTHGISATNTHEAPDVKDALDKDKSTARAPVGSASVSAASALGHGGPSDWEHFGIHAEDEIDDTYLFSPRHSVVVLPTDAAELPSKSTPPPNVREQEQATQALTQPEQLPSLLSPQVVSPAEALSSKASQPTLQTDIPPLPVPEAVAAVPRTGPVPPNLATFTETPRTGNSQGSQSGQQMIDEPMVTDSDRSEVSTGRLVPIQGAPVSSIQGNVISRGNLHQQEVLGQLQTAIPLKQIESEPTEARAAEREARLTASRAIVPDSKEESDERHQHVASVEPFISKSTEHDGKRVQHQIHDPYADLDPWAKASLSRFVVMLRNEAGASTDKEKLDVFTSFMSKESLLRAVLYGAMPDLPADGKNRLSQPAPEKPRGNLMEATPSSDVPVTPPQTGPTPSRLVDAPLLHPDTAALSPEVFLEATERSVSPAQSPSSPTREPLPHSADPPQCDKGCISKLEPETPQDEQGPSPNSQDASTQRDKSFKSDRDIDQLRRELTQSHESVPLENGSKATLQPTETRKEHSILAISIPDTSKRNESEDDIEYSPGGRPIVSRPSRGPTRGQQDAKGDPGHAPPSQGAAKRASATQSQHSTALHSPGADAPILMDITSESQTSVRPTAVAAQRTSSPMLPAVANEHPAYAPNRHTESFSSASEPSVSQSKYKAYSAPGQTVFDAGITVRIESSDLKEREALDLSSQHSNTSESVSGAFNALKKILPAEGALDPTTRSHERIAAVKREIQHVKDDFSFIKKTVATWDVEAKKTREKNERDRRLRQEQSEERIDGLFHDNEIGYSDIGVLEAEYKKIEAEKRAQEENNEQESFVRNVFEVVTAKVQREIDVLFNHYNSLLKSLGNAATCRETFNIEEERPEITQVLEVVLVLQPKLEVRHRKVVEAVLEKDRRFKKTKLAPLYTEGKIIEMKKLEKRFDLTERELILEAARRKDERAHELIHIVDEHTMRGIKDNQDYTNTILGGVRAISEAMSHGHNVDDLTDVRVHLTQASCYVSDLHANSLRLTQQSNAVDTILNDAAYDVSVAEGNVANADSETFKRLKEEKDQEDVKLQEDLEQRVSAVETDSSFIAEQIEALIARVEEVKRTGVKFRKPLPQGTTFEHQSRMQRALEQAKKRNNVQATDAEN